MSLAYIPETMHYLHSGRRVPSTAVNLGYLDVPALSPEHCVTLVAAWDDLPGNEDDPVRGTRQIRIDGIRVLDGDIWVPTIRPGNFYWTETVDDYRTNGGLAITGSDSFDASGRLAWEYTIGNQQATYASVADAVSDPYIAVSHEPISILNDYTIRVASPTVKPGTNITLYAYDGDTAVIGPITATVSDPWRGLATTSTPLNTEYSWYATYTGSSSSVAYSGYYNVDTDVWYALDLNPSPGHSSVIDTVSSELVVSDALFVVDSYGRQVLNTTSAPDGVARISGANLLLRGGALLLIQPARCWYMAPDGTATLVWQNTATIAGHVLVTWAPSDLSISTERHTLTLAQLLMRPPVLSRHITVFDSRSRGGGATASTTIQSAPELQHFFDTASCDGPITIENGVAIFRVPQALLTRVGEAALLAAASRHLAAGIACVVEPY